jgi:hypothetical protein
MKIKLIALAVAALVSGVANANIIDDGAGSGNGGLLFAIWDANSSFAVNTGMTIDSLNAAVTAGTGYNFTDSAFTNWLSTATGPVAWTIFANDQLGAQRAITTTDGSNAGVTMTNGDLRATNATNSTFINTLNTGAFAVAGVTESVALAGTAAYVGDSALSILGSGGYAYNFNSNGTLANNSYATGMGVISANAINGGTTKSIYAPLTYAGAAAHAWVAGNTFTIGNVAAVPEADSLAMLLAGMGLVGSIARRRNRKTA